MVLIWNTPCRTWSGSPPLAMRFGKSDNRNCRMNSDGARDDCCRRCEPLNYLILIDHANVLRELYGRVFIPEAVFQELQHSRTPAVVRTLIAALPDWLEV